MRTIPIQLVTTQGRDGKIQARSVLGVFARWRWGMVGLTQLLYYGLPWVSWHGQQALWFDLTAGRFYVFGAVLYPQDLIYLAGLLVASALLLFWVTAVAGRMWCGFACPQTVYTSVFMWVENRFEGSRHKRLQLDASPWTGEKVLRRGGKHLTWAAIGLWTGLTLVGYFTPIRELVGQTLVGEASVWEMFWTLFYGFATYLNAGLVREKVCLHMCPYGRFQGALMDANTLNVAYDARRGEPRQGQGDCVDCTLCVQVCPTGIDIRKGLQAACIACGLCIDACNQVMDKVRQPRGLIRLASEAELAQPLRQVTRRWAHVWRSRVVVYGVLLGAVSLALVLSFAQRAELKLNVMRDRSVMARQVMDGDVENVYRLQVMNATPDTRHVQIALLDNDGWVVDAPQDLRLLPAQALTVPVTLRLRAQAAAQQAGSVLPVYFELRMNGQPTGVQARSTFMVPASH